jgi:dipeptidyl aminopeptidase/acylaminoacyl peptidase
MMAVHVLVILVAAIPAVSYLFARLYCRPARELPGETPADLGLPFEEVAVPSHGKTLRGWFIPARDGITPFPTIIAAHGWSHSAAQMLPVVRLLYEAGFAGLVCSARGHGGSDGDGPITIRKVAEDILSEFHYLEGRQDVDGSRIGVVGHSIGGSAGILATSMDPRIRALVSMSAFADPMELTERHLTRARIPRWPFLRLVRWFIERWLGTTMSDVAPKNRISRVTAPVMLFHGESDRFIPSSDMEVIYREAKENIAKRWIVPGRRHSDIHLDPGFGPRMVDFLRGTLIEPHAC